MAGSWEWLASETLDSDGDTIDTGAFAVKRYLKVVIDLASNSGNNRPCLRFNGDDDPNYSDRYSGNGGTDGTGQDRTNIRAFGYNDPDRTKYAVVNIGNIANREKLTSQFAMDNGGDGAGNVPNRDESIGKWVNVSDAITSIQVFNDEGGNFESGSIVTVWGADDAPLVYPNLENGTIFITSDTNIHFMWNSSAETWNEVA